MFLYSIELHRWVSSHVSLTCQAWREIRPNGRQRFFVNMVFQVTLFESFLQVCYAQNCRLTGSEKYSTASIYRIHARFHRSNEKVSLIKFLTTRNSYFCKTTSAHKVCTTDLNYQS